MQAFSRVVAASDVAFGVGFAIFVLAFGVLAAVAIRWGVRTDRPKRKAWQERRLRQLSATRREESPPADDAGPPAGAQR